MPNLTKGVEKAGQVADDNRKSGFYRVRQHIMKDGEGPWYLRFLTELRDMTSADMHMFCATKVKPEEYQGDNWPKAMMAVCQNDRMFRVLGPNGEETDAYETGYGDCYIHNRDRGKKKDGKFKRDMSSPDWQTFALAVVREQVLDEVTKKPRGYRDATDEYKKEDGTLVRIPRIVVISQKHRNFWSGVEAALFDGGETPLGAYDFKVTRKENDYSFAVSPASQVLYPGSAEWARYTDALELVGYSLDEEIIKWGSLDWYRRWFIEGAVPEGGYGRAEEDADEDGTATAEPAGEAIAEEQVDDFRTRLQAGRQAVSS